MELLLFGPAHQRQSAYLDGSLSDSYFTAQESRFLQGAGCDDTQATLAQIVDRARNCVAPSPGANLGQWRDGDLEVLGEPCLPASIAFGSCLHGKLSLRHACQEVHSSDGVVPGSLSRPLLHIAV